MIEQIKGKARELMKGINTAESEGFIKYVESDYQINEKMKMICALHLDGGIRKDCLDISTCFGWLPWILKQYGHNVYYTDNLNERTRLQIEARKRLGLDECVHFQYQREEGNTFKFQKLPNFNLKFDIISAVAVQPHSYFNEDQWGLFLRDALSHLKINGVLYVAPNRSPGRLSLDKVVRGFNTKAVKGGYRILT